MTKDTKLNPKNSALAVGIVAGIYLFISTILNIMGLSNSYEFISKTVWTTLGYNLSFIGAILGGIYAFIWSFVVVFAIIFIYNKLNN